MIERKYAEKVLEHFKTCEYADAFSKIEKLLKDGMIVLGESSTDQIIIDKMEDYGVASEEYFDSNKQLWEIAYYYNSIVIEKDKNTTPINFILLALIGSKMFYNFNDVTMKEDSDSDKIIIDGKNLGPLCNLLNENNIIFSRREM
jgi:hypothetical protein